VIMEIIEFKSLIQKENLFQNLEKEEMKIINSMVHMEYALI